MKRLIYLIMLTLLFGSCKTGTVNVVDRVDKDSISTINTRIDSVFIKEFLRDSIYVHDSIYVEKKGDSTIIEKNHTIIKYIEVGKENNERHLGDSVRVEVHTDSIPYPVEVTKKEPYVPSIYKAAMWFSIFVIFIGFIFVLIKILVKK